MNHRKTPNEPRQEFAIVGDFLTLVLLFGVLPLVVWLISLLWAALSRKRSTEVRV